VERSDTHHFRFRREDFLTGGRYVRGNRRPLQSTLRDVTRKKSPPPQPGGFFRGKGRAMSLSSAKNYALRAERSQDPKEAADLLAKAILELAASIEATDAKVKKMNKSG
jgi:hypothetical protein